MSRTEWTDDDFRKNMRESADKYARRRPVDESVWENLAAGMRYADSVPMGLVNINETTNYWEVHLPWGGRARSESGIGRVGGRYPMDTLTELQTVMFRA